MNLRFIATLCISAFCLSGWGQIKKMTMEKDALKTNPLLCDPVSGVCEIPSAGNGVNTQAIHARQKPVKVVYFTDPICSSCWGIEPQLRRLKLEYGGDVEIDYRMGGLLPNWTYNSGGISKPSDVAHHWDEVSVYYKMPIDGDVWLSDPLSSSFPPSIAFKAAQMQSPEKAVVFLRIIREMVFLQKKNITKWEHLAEAAVQAGLDSQQLKADYDGKAKDRFNEDLLLASKSGVRGFPTLFVTNANGQTETIYGFRPYETFEAGLAKVYSAAIKTAYSKDWQHLFGVYPTLTLREFAELRGITFPEAEQQLTALVNEQHLTVFNTKNGALWSKK